MYYFREQVFLHHLWWLQKLLRESGPIRLAQLVQRAPRIPIHPTDIAPRGNVRVLGNINFQNHSSHI